MKKTLVRGLVMAVLGIALAAGSAWATTLTIDVTTLAQFYETFEDPTATGTALFSVKHNIEIDNSENVKYVGNIDPDGEDDGWGEIWIGANSSGVTTNQDLGLGNLTGYDSFALNLNNVNENPWQYQLYFTAGNYTIESGWTSINNGDSAVVTLDFTNANVYDSTTDFQNIGINIGKVAGLDLANISSIGFQVGWRCTFRRGELYLRGEGCPRSRARCPAAPLASVGRRGRYRPKTYEKSIT